jgi:hypothetical protein
MRSYQPLQLQSYQKQYYTPYQQQRIYWPQQQRSYLPQQQQRSYSPQQPLGYQQRISSRSSPTSIFSPISRPQQSYYWPETQIQSTQY